MDIKHPGQYIQQELTQRGRTQKDFAHILGKKVSEVNELIKGKRNITIQRDILLATVFDDAPQKWINQQMEYDYQTSSQSVDQQKIDNIKIRKNIVEEARAKVSGTQGTEIEDKEIGTEDVGSKIQEIGSLEPKIGSETEEIGEEISTNPIASEEQSPTILDTENLAELPGKDDPEDKQDQRQKHEIFRNF